MLLKYQCSKCNNECWALVYNTESQQTHITCLKCNHKDTIQNIFGSKKRRGVKNVPMVKTKQTKENTSTGPTTNQGRESDTTNNQTTTIATTIATTNGPTSEEPEDPSNRTNI